jgi:hypothetical protein
MKDLTITHQIFFQNLLESFGKRDKPNKENIIFLSHMNFSLRHDEVLRVMTRD